jgi:hypothetical protein
MCTLELHGQLNQTSFTSSPQPVYFSRCLHLRQATLYMRIGGDDFINSLFSGLGEGEEADKHFS